MKKTYICLKDQPVLEISSYSCRILDYDRLPVSLRYESVGFDDVMHGWTENRTMSVGRTNAKKLLTTTDISINEISLKTGFNDYFYFLKTFKKYTGHTPSEYRNLSYERD